MTRAAPRLNMRFTSTNTSEPGDETHRYDHSVSAILSAELLTTSPTRLTHSLDRFLQPGKLVAVYWKHTSIHLAVSCASHVGRGLG